jgi:hypothetical protein
MSMVHWGADLEYYDRMKEQTRSKEQGTREHHSPQQSSCPLPPAPCPFISTGKELRDYETLLQAFHETGLPLTLFVERRRQAYFEGLRLIGPNIDLHYGDRPIPHEIAQLVARSRCVCICCQKSNYTVGLTTVVEALALGLPILCTHNPQMPMDIEAEGCGFWLEPNDVEGWKDKLCFIAAHPDEERYPGLGTADSAFMETMEAGEREYRKYLDDSTLDEDKKAFYRNCISQIETTKVDLFNKQEKNKAWLSLIRGEISGDLQLSDNDIMLLTNLERDIPKL